jgi:sulfane dehydrogenase subunit SoxC
MVSQSEWTGVPLALLFRDVGVQPAAGWFLAEGGDASRLARSIPVAKANDDALVVWAQNGEPLRPEQGFPIRLLLPGFEGNSNVKWLRRIKLGRDPFMTRWETSKYTDPLLGGKVRQFSFEMDAKSVITTPAYPERLTGPGWWPIRGLAWSGRGRIARVDVSTDGGAHWMNADLLTALTPKAQVRFEHMWQWDGRESLLMSRAVDDQSYVQPTTGELLAARGPGTDYHFNGIRAWRVARGGTITFEGAT